MIIKKGRITGTIFLGRRKHSVDLGHKGMVWP